MRDVTMELKKLVDKLERVGAANGYNLEAEEDEIKRLKFILNNLFCR